MKRIAIVLLIIILLVAIGFGIYFMFFNEKPPIEIPEPPVVDSGEELDPAEKINIETALTETQTQRRFVNVKMPTFTNLSDYSFQEIINKEIADSINPYVNEIAVVADESLPSTVKYKYEVSFERFNNENYISLVVLQNYATGGMRSNTWKDTYTIDVLNNRKITLADICDFEDYKEVIVEEVNRQADENNISLIAGNGLSDIPDTQRFYIKDEKLYIYFEPASIAPYLDGEMHFKMPFDYEDGKFILD